MNEYFPDVSKGWLPAFIMLVGITAITNALQSYRDISYLQRVYNPPLPNHNMNPKTGNQNASAPNQRTHMDSVTNTANPTSEVTPLSARTFGTWNVAVGVVRLYAAYNLHERSWFQMSFLTNIIGLVHFSLEAFVYKTARPSGPWLAPTSVAMIGAIWHILEYDNYVK